MIVLRIGEGILAFHSRDLDRGGKGRFRYGGLLPLSSIVRLKQAGVAAELDRHVQRRAVEVDAELDAGHPLQAAVDDLRGLADALLPPDVEVILLGEFADQLRDEGKSVREVILGRARVRLRPVMMTLLSTILRALPLILGSGSGAGAEARGLWSPPLAPSWGSSAASARNPGAGVRGMAA